MKTVLVTLAPGFEEIETITIVDILRRAGARVTMAATVAGVLEGSRGIKVEPDELLDNVMEKDFDLSCQFRVALQADKLNQSLFP